MARRISGVSRCRRGSPGALWERAKQQRAGDPTGKETGQHITQGTGQRHTPTYTLTRRGEVSRRHRYKGGRQRR